MRDKPIAPEMVQEWRNLRKAPHHMKMHEIARKYGVSENTVWRKLQDQVVS